jgi:hypothetical protein
MAQTLPFEADGGTLIVRFQYRRTTNKVRTVYDGTASQKQEQRPPGELADHVDAEAGAAFKALPAPQSLQPSDQPSLSVLTPESPRCNIPAATATAAAGMYN